MSLAKRVKRAILSTNGLGMGVAVARSNWRQNRLLILCYHGIAMGDEAGSHPEMFLPPATFARRMEILSRGDCRVLPLGEALRLLQAGKLPPRSVAITFDDGWADFRESAFPILQRFGFPATVYLTTYYCLFNRPLFRFALAYVMWKRRDYPVAMHAAHWSPGAIDLRTQDSRTALLSHIDEYAKRTDMSGKQKDDLVAEFAEAVGFDYTELLRQRLFHLMNPAEISEMARGGIDFQLHTHRHRTPLDGPQFIREIEENRSHLRDLAGPGDYTHFCYPSGANRPEFSNWLKEAGVRSATTCMNGLAGSTSDPYLLPRLLDQCGLSDNEFESWVSGLAAFLPRRPGVALDVAPE
jgi:peptidoglycan/xylan/chitin deacetylase (PgdA/CDA1 family)